MRTRNFTIYLTALTLLGMNAERRALAQQIGPLTGPYEETFENQTIADLWYRYVRQETVDENTSGSRLQPDCMPRFFPAREGVQRKGMVMFFHGFSACPQQYFRIAPQLSAQGYDVFLPTLPGHGRRPNPEGSDYLADLPSKSTNSRPLRHESYERFIMQMNGIAKESSGEKILAGLSGGGGLATAAAITSAEAKSGIWDRLLLYAPFYKNPGSSQALVNSVGLLRPQTVNDWGESCRLNRSRPDGRNGFCSVTVGSVLAIRQFARTAAEKASLIDIPVQFVGVEKDPTVDNSAINNVYKDIPNASFCFYPEGTPHSLIYPEKDLLPATPEFADYREDGLPTGPPYAWTSSLDRYSIEFITHGVSFPSYGSSQVEFEYGNDVPMCTY